MGWPRPPLCSVTILFGEASSVAVLKGMQTSLCLSFPKNVCNHIPQVLQETFFPAPRPQAVLISAVALPQGKY